MLRILSSKVDRLPVEVTSAVVVESAARFRDASVVQLLDPQSAINHLLSLGNLFRLYLLICDLVVCVVGSDGLVHHFRRLGADPGGRRCGTAGPQLSDNAAVSA